MVLPCFSLVHVLHLLTNHNTEHNWANQDAENNISILSLVEITILPVPAKLIGGHRPDMSPDIVHLHIASVLDTSIYDESTQEEKVFRSFRRPDPSETKTPTARGTQGEIQRWCIEKTQSPTPGRKAAGN